MTSRRTDVAAALEFGRPARIPRFDSFQEFPDEWRGRLGDPAGLSDIEIWVPNEGAFCRRERVVSRDCGETVQIDRWGATVRSGDSAYFVETLDVAIPTGVDPDSVEFDSPYLDERFGAPRDARTAERYVFGKTGGPYLRTTFVRGEMQFLIDIATDAHLARVLADKMADHLLAVGVEQIRRWHLEETGMSIWDDMAFNQAPMVSPDQFERIFLPGYRRMIAAFKDAGAPHVLFHSDGNVLPLLDMLVDAGIDALNPLERRAGMDPFLVRDRYPDLALVGGMDNTGTLIDGPPSRIENEARELIDLGSEGGLVIGTHSISPDVPLENFMVYDRVCRTYGDFSLEPAGGRV
jgi:hypothetical protein